MTVQPSSADKTIQNKLVKDLKTAGLWDKAKFIDLFSTHSGGSLINWKNPSVYNPVLIGTPYFEPYLGYRGSTGNAINLKYIPSVDDPTSQNNVCQIIGVGDNRKEIQDDFGAYTSPGAVGRINIRATHDDGNSYFRCHDGGTGAVANSNSIKHFAISRNGAANFSVYLNKIKSTISAASNGLTDKELYACGSNNNGTLAITRRIVRYVCRFSYLTETEIGSFIDIIESYLSNYHTNLINYDSYIAKPYLATRAIVPLTTYDGSNETIHPSVIDCGADWNGYRYWMANTPYPLANSDLENPSIWASADGATWVVPTGVTNPIIAKPIGGYNSDADLYFENGTLYMIYKEGVSGTYRIKLVSSTDGVNWSAPKIILPLLTGESQDISPTLIKIGTTYYLYYVCQKTNGQFDVRRASCLTIDGTYSNAQTISAPTETGLIWWHMHIIQYNGAYYISALSSTAPNPNERVYILKSTDGVNFVKCPYAILNIDKDAVNSNYYRPNIALINGQPTIYCSGTISGKYGVIKMNIDLL